MTNEMSVIVSFERCYFKEHSKIINKTQSMVRKSKKKNESQ